MVIDQTYQMRQERQEIVKAIRSGDLERAVGICQDLLAAEPTDVQTAARLALLSFHVQDPDNACDSLLLAAENATDWSSSPRIVQIEVTRRCNLACSMCPRTVSLQEAGPRTNSGDLHSYWQRDLDPHLFPFLLAQCSDAESVMLHGIGEPLLYPYLRETVSAATQRQLDISFFSNGMLLDRDRSQMLISLAVSKITFSIDGASRPVFERIRQGGCLNHLLENVRNLVDLKRCHASILPQIAFHVTLNADNQSEVSSILELGAEMGANQVSISPIEPADSLISSYQTAPGLLEEDLEHWRSLAGQLGLRLVAVGLDQYIRLQSLSRNTPGFCIWPWMGLYISVEGNVLPCCHLTDARRFALGDIRTETVDEIWNGEAFRAFRKGILDRNPLADRCRSCLYAV